MPLNRPSVDVIYNRLITGIETRLTGGFALLQRSVLRILAKVFSGGMHLLYGVLVFLSKQLLVDQAEDDWLDRHGIIWGVSRKAAAFASGSVIFSGEDGTIIPKGTIVQNASGFEYATDDEATVFNGSSFVGVTAVESGAGSNFSSTTLELISPITGLDTEVTIYIGGISGGMDLESNDDYRARILERIQNPPMGGTAKDYVLWAKSDQVSSSHGSVGNAWCFPLAAGPGTVDVVITAFGEDPVASSGLLQDVQTYIDLVRPVTADVTVKTVTAAALSMQLTISPDTAENQNLIIQNMRDLLNTIAAPGKNLLISHVRDAIMDSGIDDYTIDEILVDSSSVPVADIQFVDYEFPVLDTITFN